MRNEQKRKGGGDKKQKRIATSRISDRKTESGWFGGDAMFCEFCCVSRSSGSLKKSRRVALHLLATARNFQTWKHQGPWTFETSQLCKNCMDECQTSHTGEWGRQCFLSTHKRSEETCKSPDENSAHDGKKCVAILTISHSVHTSIVLIYNKIRSAELNSFLPRYTCHGHLLSVWTTGVSGKKRVWTYISVIPSPSIHQPHPTPTLCT